MSETAPVTAGPPDGDARGDRSQRWGHAVGSPEAHAHARGPRQRCQDTIERRGLQTRGRPFDDVEPIVDEGLERRAPQRVSVRIVDGSVSKNVGVSSRRGAKKTSSAVHVAGSARMRRRHGSDNASCGAI
jgi:hypothetical protein